METGICFAGGGIKCAAHVGAIKAFEEQKIKFNYVSGTSSGSIVALLYALDYSAKEMYEIIKKYSQEIKYIEFRKIIKLIFDIIIYRKIKIDGLNSGKKLEKIIEKICAEKNVKYLADINKKILIPSVDLCDGKVFIFNSSNNRGYSNNIIYDNTIEISKAIRASCGYPGVFCPFKYKNTKLVDGGIRENVPWKELKKMGAQEVLSITFSKKIKRNCEKNIINVIEDSLGILCHELAGYETSGADEILEIELEDVDLLEAEKIDYVYEKGYLETKKFLENRY